MSLARAVDLSEEFMREISAILGRDIRTIPGNCNLQALRELYNREPNALAYYVRLLAKGEVTDETVVKVDFIVQLKPELFRAEACAGYAWGGHEYCLEAYRDLFYNRYIRGEVMGYALARNIEKVNDKNDGWDFYALEGYVAGGHVVDSDKTLELITLTLSQTLKEALAEELKKIIPELDVLSFLKKAELLNKLIKQKNISFSAAHEELLSIDQPGQLRDSSYRFFTSELTDCQKIAAHSLAEFGLIASHLFYWRGENGDKQFYPSHEYALKCLIVDHKLSPQLAVQEINGLSDLQAQALTKLYQFGLRGQHFRDNPCCVILEEVECLLKKVIIENMDPGVVVKDIMKKRSEEAAPKKGRQALTSM